MDNNRSILKQAETLYSARAISQNTLGNSANLIFEMEIGKTPFISPFILRVSEYSEKKLAHIDLELNWVNYLAKTLNSIVKPVMSVNNKLYEVIQTNDKKYILCLFEKAKGKVVDIKSPDEFNGDLFFNLGVLMGNMHRLTMEYDGNIVNSKFEWHNNHFLAGYDVILDEEVQPFEKRYINELHTLTKSKDCYGIIHQDIHTHNLFINDGQIKLFDFDDCYFSWYAYDIASALLMMVQFGVGFNSDKVRSEFAENYLLTYLKGYTQQNNVNKYWIHKFDLFMKYRMTTSYKFVQNNWRYDPVHPHQWFLDWHKNRIINDLPYVNINYDKIIRSLPFTRIV